MTENENFQKVLAIIRRPHVAVEDHSGQLCIAFDTYITECSAASQWVSPTEERFISLWGAMKGDINNLDGKPCWVKTGGGLIIFEKVADV